VAKKERKSATRPFVDAACAPDTYKTGT
jgi:hypothetical protein